MSLVVSRQREAEIPLALMKHPHSVWPAISDVANSQRAHSRAVMEAQKFSEIPLACIQAQHVARWIDVAEIPTWARLRDSSDCHSVRKQLLCV